MLEKIVVRGGSGAGPYGSYNISFIFVDGSQKYGIAGSDAVLHLIKYHIKDNLPDPYSETSSEICIPSLETSRVPWSIKKGINKYLRTLNHE